MNAKTMELAELLDEANRQREQIPELADTDPFTERTFYYYVQQGLLPRSSRRRGPGTTYPPEFVDRLLLIRRLQKEQGLTLSNIRGVLDSTDADMTIHRAARGVDPVNIRLSASELDLESEGPERGLSLRSRLFGKRRTERERPEFSRIREESGSRPAPASDDETESRYPIGENAWLVVDKALTPLQQKRLEQVVVLLRSILEEDD